MSDKSIIEICGVSKNYGDVPALEKVDLKISSGEFFSLLGPSGCGKSTLLRMLAGFEVPSDGEIYIDGEPMSGVPAHLRPVNIVFQNYAIFPHLNVRRNIAFGMRKSGLSHRQIDDRVEDMLGTIKLSGYGERTASQLSGGERQRVALARALIKQPKVLLLDEPLSALDRKLRERMQFELRELQEKVGVTFVFVTHDQDEALTMSDRIAVMAKGAVHQVGTPEVVYERPATQFVADFIGTMNFFPGTIREQGDSCIIVEGGALGSIILRPVKTSHHVGQKVLMAARPEMFSISSKKPSNGALIARGKIAQFTYAGDRRNVAVKIPGREQPVTVSVNSKTQVESLTGRSGDTVWIGCDAEALLLISNT